MKDHPSLKAEADRRGVAVEELRREALPVREILGRSSTRTGSRPRALSLQERRAPATKENPVGRPPVAEAELAEALRSMGHSEAGALAAARGRGGRSNATGLVEAARDLGLSPAKAKTFAAGRGIPEVGSLVAAGRRLGLSDAKARCFARGRQVVEAVVRNIAGLSAACFAWVPDPEDPSTWQLQIARADDSGDGAWVPDEDLVRRAVAMVPGIAGYDQALEIPASDLPGVKAILRAAWVACGAALDEMPFELNQESLRKAFGRLGMSEAAAAVAAAGRGRRW